MNSQRFFFRTTIRVAAAGGASDDVAYECPVEHAYAEITRWSVEDETSAPASIRTVVTGHGEEYMLDEQDPAAAATLYWDADRTIISDREQLVARFFGATAADVLKLHVEGWIVPLGEEPV